MLLITVLPWSIAPMSITAVACGLLTLGMWLRSTRPRWPSTPVNRAAIGWLVALLTSATFAIAPAASFPRVSKALFPMLVPLAVFHTQDARTGRRALGLLLFSSAMAALYGTTFFVAHGASLAARARGPAGHYMTFGGQLLLEVAVAVPVALLARDRRWRLGAAAVAALGLVALATTFTRSAWLGLAAALGAVLVGVRPRWLPAFLVLLAGLYAFAPGAYRDRLHSAFDPAHPANRERTYMWDAGVRMFRDHPITGVGLQDLHPIYERYRPPGAHEGAGHLHSVPIQVAASMGLVGLAAFVWLYGSLFRAAGSGLRPMLRTPDVEAGLRLGAVAGLVGFLVAGLFEWNFGDEELLYLLFTLAGLAWSARRWTAGLEAATGVAPSAPPAARATVATGSDPR
jgi:O-antigen ligase